jgi:hypothetical protein
MASDQLIASSCRPIAVWDLGNLVKPTLDAMEGVFGLRAKDVTDGLRADLSLFRRR